MSGDSLRFDLYDLSILSAEPQALTRSDDEIEPNELWRVESGHVALPRAGCVHDILDFDGLKRLQVWHVEPKKIVVSHDDTRVEWDAYHRRIVLDLSPDLTIPAAVILERVVAPMAFMLLNRGKVALHASAVADEHGRAWIFIGNSGAGKSTTAFELMRRKMALLADDLVLLDSQKMEVIAATPTLRLFDDPDSVPEAVQAQPVMPGVEKFWYQLPDRKDRKKRFEIGGIFLLEPTDEGKTARITELSGVDGTAKLLAQAFDLNQAPPEFRVRRFQELCQIARDRPILQVCYARHDRRVPAQVEAILNYLQAQDGR